MRPQLEVILEHDGLAVEVKVLVVGLRLHHVEEAIDERDQTQSELLVGEVPLAIPVRVGHDVDLQLLPGRLDG
jgi:hypothetical protein